MSSKYIVRQQIKDTAGNTVGYEILYHGENQAFSSADPNVTNEFAAADTIYNFLTQNSNKVLKGSLNFMTFTSMLLMRKTPRLFDKSDLVIQIDDSVIIHPLSMHFVTQYARDGYKIAVNEFQFAPRYMALMDSIDYIKINVKTTNDISMRNIIEISHSMNKRCIMTNIDDVDLYNKAIKCGADYLEGTYVSEQVKTPTHSSAYLQSNFFRLMVAITKDEPDVDEIERLISADVSLTYGILKIVNSAYFALRHRASTVHQAVVTLGLGQLKQWIYLLSASGADNQMDASTEEFLKLSFMRGNFASELMNYAKDMPASKGEAYLLGMFSTLNYLINAPMEEILEEIPIADEIKEALLNKTGRCGTLYKLILSYESADWDNITSYAEELGIPDNVLTNVYFNCVENVNILWRQLTSASTATEGEEEVEDENAAAEQE